MDDNGVVLPRINQNLGRESRAMIRLNSISRNPAAGGGAPSPGGSIIGSGAPSPGGSIMSRHRRRSVSSPLLFSAAAAALLLLLLLALSLLHTRLTFPSVLPLPSSNPDPVPDRISAASTDVDRIQDLDGDDDDDDDLVSDDPDPSLSRSGYFWDHAAGVARMSFGKNNDPLPSTWTDRDRDRDLSSFAESDDRIKIKAAFASDDQPVDEEVRVKLSSISSIEDSLLLRTASGGGGSPLRDGWERWLEGKADFLRRDRMLRSNLELLNPKNHPLLQDPDMPGLSSLTRGDRLMQRAILQEMEHTPFPGGGEVKRVELRKTLDLPEEKNVTTGARRLYADGRRWGYFPGIEAHLSFSQFMGRFLERGRCGLRVFMVWNSPPWTYGVRHQRGLESLLYHNRDACVVVFSETMELDFFREFVKEGYKIAVVMPNLDELLKDTPAHVFASVWFEWRKTKHYHIHYSELVRLAALYKYGGVYLDSDIIVLRKLNSLEDFVAVEDQASESSIYNGAVMAFKKGSPFLMKCLEEFYSTYDDARLRWNGAELVTRVISRVSSKHDNSYRHLGLQIKSPLAKFPISSMNITRYFMAAPDERTHQEFLFRSILNESITFHCWNGLTSALVPEPNSLVERLLNRYCLHCLDVL